MKGRSGRQTIKYGLISLLVFGAIFVASFRGFGEEKDAETPGIVAFGDSVFGLIRDETSVTALLSELLETPVFNAGFGGSCMAKTELNYSLGYTRNSLSMAGLSTAILADDFGVQQGTRWRESNMEYFPEVIDALAAVDFAEVETVLLQHGLNDYHSGTMIENPEDLYDKYTYTGALRSSVEALREVNPHVRIVLVTPTYTWYEQLDLTCGDIDYGGGLLEDYVAAQLRVAKELGVEDRKSVV